MSTATIVGEIGGFPFIDTSFEAGRLLTAVACCRRIREDPNAVAPTPEQLTAALHPSAAARVRRLDLVLDLPFGELSSEQHHQVEQTRTLIIEWIPRWAPLITVPLQFHELQHSSAVSSSNFAWPQHIFLAPTAFTTRTTLAEQIVHETSHQWLYFIEELWPLQHQTPDRRFTLPSGTPGRSASELLGASHVTINLHRLWSVMPTESDLRQRRLQHLRAYGAGCADLLRQAHDVLTPGGHALAARLTEELQAL